jgi:hypothetical protein
VPVKTRSILGKQCQRGLNSNNALHRFWLLPILIEFLRLLLYSEEPTKQKSVLEIAPSSLSMSGTMVERLVDFCHSELRPTWS